MAAAATRRAPAALAPTLMIAVAWLPGPAAALRFPQSQTRAQEHEPLDAIAASTGASMLAVVEAVSSEEYVGSCGASASPTLRASLRVSLAHLAHGICLRRAGPDADPTAGGVLEAGGQAAALSVAAMSTETTVLPHIRRLSAILTGDAADGEAQRCAELDEDVTEALACASLDEEREVELASGRADLQARRIRRHLAGGEEDLYACGFAGILGGLGRVLKNDVRYGNWCGFNSRDAAEDGFIEWDATVLPSHNISFRACDVEGDTTNISRARTAFDGINLVCPDSGLDEACLHHDYGAFSKDTQYYALMECKVNQDLRDRVASHTHSTFVDPAGRKEATLAKSVVCAMEMFPCLTWRDGAFKKVNPFGNFPQVKAGQSPLGDGCGPTGCYLYEELPTGGVRMRTQEVKDAIRKLSPQAASR